MRLTRALNNEMRANLFIKLRVQVELRTRVLSPVNI